MINNILKIMKDNYTTVADFNEMFATNKWGLRETNEIYTFTNAFSREEIEIIKNYCEQLEPDNAQIGADYDSYTVKEDVRTSVVRWVPINEDTRFIYERLFNLINEANDELWGFDITGFYESAQYTEYYGNNEGHYDWHLDIGNDIDYRKISITIQLSDNDEYEGGDLQFMTGPKIDNAGKELGMATLFPSFLIHRVSNVTKGVRKSLVLWVTGPSFR